MSSGTGASLLVFMTVAPPALAQSAPAEGSGTIETVVVTARLQAEMIKLDAPYVLDIRPESDIVKPAHVTLGEALQRVPGVSLETDTGEGRFVNIRGMDADLKPYDLRWRAPHGLKCVYAAGWRARRCVRRVSVRHRRRRRSDQIAHAGHRRGRPRRRREYLAEDMPEGTGELLDVSAGSGVETLRGSPGMGRAGHGRIPGSARRTNVTAIVSYEYHEDWRGIDDIENGGAFPNFPSNLENDLNIAGTNTTGGVKGVAGSVSWDVDSDTTLFARGFYAGYTEYAHKHRLEIDNLNTENSGATPTPSVGNEYVIDDAAPLQSFTELEGARRQQASRIRRAYDLRRQPPGRFPRVMDGRRRSLPLELRFQILRSQQCAVRIQRHDRSQPPVVSDARRHEPGRSGELHEGKLSDSSSSIRTRKSAVSRTSPCRSPSATWTAI